VGPNINLIKEWVANVAFLWIGFELAWEVICSLLIHYVLVFNKFCFIIRAL
jgi:hypothetical protein